MALLPPAALDCVVALGRQTTKGSVWIGTGFFFGHLREKSPDGMSAYDVYLVSNRHVYEALGSGGLVRLNPEPPAPAQELRVTLQHPDGSLAWFKHPDIDMDVAVVPVNVEALEKHKIPIEAFWSDTAIATMADMKELGVTEGDGTFVLGYPMTLVGPQRNFVVVRQGCLARIRDTLAGLSKDFLIDCPAFPGNSGGPVILRPELAAIKGTKPSKKAVLIGVVAQNLSYQDVAVSTQTQRPRVIFEENTGLARVMPVDAIMDIVQARLNALKKPTITATGQPTELAPVPPSTPAPPSTNTALF